MESDAAFQKVEAARTAIRDHKSAADVDDHVRELAYALGLKHLEVGTLQAMKAVLDRLDNPDQHEPLHHLAAQWLCSVNPSLDEAKCISIIDTPTKRDKMNMHRSLWRQILFQCSKHIEACQFAWC